MPPSSLFTGHPVLDPDQPIWQAEGTLALLVWGMEQGPEQVVPILWTWGCGVFEAVYTSRN